MMRRPGNCNDECNSGGSYLGGTALPQGPELCFLELTHTCNSRCPGCLNNSFVADFRTRALLPVFAHRPLDGKRWIEVIDRLGSSVQTINLSGGEPTTHPDFAQIAEAINARRIDFHIFTNARWREPERLIDLLAGLNQFRGLLVSLHGATAATHEEFSGVAGSFAETCANITLARRAGLNVTLSSVLTQTSITELRALTELAAELEVDDIVFNRYLVPTTRENQPTAAGTLRDMMPTPETLRQAVQEIEDLRVELGEEQIGLRHGPCVPQCFTPSSSRGCTAGETFLVVDPWGNVKPCLQTTLQCGNVLEQEIMTIWQGAPLQSWRALDPAECSGCAAKSTCRSGCRAMHLASGLGRDPLMRGPLNHTPESRVVIPLALSDR